MTATTMSEAADVVLGFARSTLDKQNQSFSRHADDTPTDTAGTSATTANNSFDRPAVHDHMRNAIVGPTGYNPRELEGIRSPVNIQTIDGDMINNTHDFDQPIAADGKFVEAVLELHRKRSRALAHSIATKDSSLARANHKRRPFKLSIGNYAYIHLGSRPKTQPTLSRSCELVRIEDSYRYILLDHTTGTHYQASIQNLVKADPPRPATTSSTDAMTPRIKPTTRRLVTTPSGLHIVSGNGGDDGNGDMTPVYSNSRPKAKRTQQRWTLQPKMTVQIIAVLQTFNLERSAQGHLVLPRQTQHQ